MEKGENRVTGENCGASAGTLHLKHRTAGEVCGWKRPAKRHLRSQQDRLEKLPPPDGKSHGEVFLAWGGGALFSPV